MKKGIDVSRWQGTIDWDKVKKDGIDFAILRCGYGTDTKSNDDRYFSRNVAECERVGMPYGVYLYSYANSVADAESEAKHVLRLLKGTKPQYPIYYDLEDANTTGKCSKDLILKIAKKFVGMLEEAGYWVGIYANKHWNITYLTDSWYNSKARWIAQYNDKCTYKGDFGIWQYTSVGKVNGIKGYADMNYAYVDYPKLIKEAGKNGFSKSTNSTKPTSAHSTSVKKKSIDEIAHEVIQGKWGNGDERKNRLIAAGYNYEAVRKRVNELVKKPKKSIDTIAREVIRGEWGNGNERKNRLIAAGYDYEAVRKRVNELI